MTPWGCYGPNRYETDQEINTIMENKDTVHIVSGGLGNESHNYHTIMATTATRVWVCVCMKKCVWP